MRELVLKMSISIDGFVGGAADSSWALRAGTSDSAAWVRDTIENAGVHALGRASFEELIAYYPAATIPVARGMNLIPKVVFTRRSGFDPAALAAGIEDEEIRDSWASTRVANGDLIEEISRLKQEDGGYILAQAGTGICRSLIRSGLVDEFRLVVAPIVLGTGDALFGELAAPLDLQLVSSTAFSGGVIANVYRPKV